MPAKTVEVDGEDWDLDDNPSMGTVKYVQNLQMDIFKERLTEEQLSELADDGGGEVSESDMMKKFLDNEGMDGMMDMMWDNSVLPTLQTICLASDRKVTMDQVDEMGSQKFITLKEASEEALGGDAQDFFKMLGLDTSFQQNETLQETVENMEQTGDESPPASRNLMQPNE